MMMNMKCTILHLPLPSLLVLLHLPHLLLILSSSLSPGAFPLHLHPSPICYPWEGGKLLAHSPDYDEMVVTRDDYEENGHCVCEENFDV